MKTFVAPALLARLERQRTGPNPPDADYFIKAQDYFDDWQQSLSANVLHSGPRTAAILVSMGRTPATSHAVRITLIKTEAR